MKFGENNPGKPKGALNKTTKLVKDVFAEVFTDLQSHPTANLKKWAIEEPTEFYKLASKLIPTQINADVNMVKLENLSDVDMIMAIELTKKAQLN